MNKVILIGRLTKDPDIRVSSTGVKTARYTLAIDRMGEGADYPNCVSFGKSAEWAEKWLTKGMKIGIEGRIQTGSYEKDGRRVYTTDVVVDRHEFVESKKREDAPEEAPDDFMRIPEGIDEEAPFV